MRNHTTPRFHELVSTQGKQPALTPAAPLGPTVQFVLQSVPTGSMGKFWYYAMSVVFRVTVRIGQGASAISAAKLWKIVQSMQLQSPLLGMLCTHSNTRGSVLGNVIQYLGYGFNGTPLASDVPSGSSNTDVTLYYRLPLSWEFLRKPHESAPWGGFLEGSTFEVKMAPNTILGGDSEGATLTTPSSCHAWLEMIPVPEPIIHTPTQWRDFDLAAGGSSRHTIPDVGSPDGLQGIDMQKGVGVAALYYLTNVAGLGLEGSGTAANILGYDIPWRDQPRIECPDANFVSQIVQQGYAGRAGESLGTASPREEFPYTVDANVSGQLNSADAMVFPLVTPSRDQETSKLQTVAGAKDINYQFTSVPSGHSRYLGLFFLQHERGFMERLAAQIAPGGPRQLVAKTLNKQTGIIHGVGKAAYTRAKVIKK